MLPPFKNGKHENVILVSKGLGRKGNESLFAQICYPSSCLFNSICVANFFKKGIENSFEVDSRWRWL